MENVDSLIAAKWVIPVHPPEVVLESHSVAVRDGNMKYLKMLDNTFLFDVIADPMERADLKQRRPEVFQQLVTRWLEWNATMLPEVDESQTGGNDGATWADHVGSPLPTRKADNPPAPAR